jgi:acyl-CoA thioesterase
MKSRILLSVGFFVLILVCVEAQIKPDTLAKRKELVQKIQNSSKEEIRNAYKSTHPVKPKTKIPVSKKKLKKSEATKTISGSL